MLVSIVDILEVICFQWCVLYARVVSVFFDSLQLIFWKLYAFSGACYTQYWFQFLTVCHKLVNY